MHWWIKSMLGKKCTDHLIMRWENLYYCTHDRLSYLTYHMTENVHPKWSWSYVTIFSFSARFIFTPLAFMCLIRNYSSWLQQTQMVVVRIIKDHISYMILILYIHIHMYHKYEISRIFSASCRIYLQFNWVARKIL